MVLNLHSVIPVSTVNGPGLRTVIFFQGCARDCRNCFNPATHPFDAGFEAGVEGVCRQARDSSVEGITISGGEPFSQPLGLTALLKTAREVYGLSTVVYTGFTLEEIEEDERLCKALEFIDVLVDGPYDFTRPEKTTLARGSTNQRLHILTPRYGIKDFYMAGKIEVRIGVDGAVVATGFGEINAEGI
ncbi:MAG: 4Fe-4S single cluster domain-containing protein [Thermodesulfobacteriota bacterium]|nr:MAG: 4Fe-4S single cluster domain-containing protein [Thermodesulfobacteriota bacterium]